VRLNDKPTRGQRLPLSSIPSEPQINTPLHYNFSKLFLSPHPFSLIIPQTSHSNSSPN
jgi:hypothetical protein